jgi:DNA polymerase III subunit gamma/tau
MGYKALYRTYRPQKFSEVIGQDIIVKTLQNSIITEKISHAYLFSGPRGTGKTSIARIFAKALNCHNINRETGEPCLECTSCTEIAISSSPDVIEIDAASNNGVEQIRDIREKVKFLPSGAKYKIYIIDEVHMLSGSAFNALLKTLEEPPAHAIFILATTEPNRVIPTILSRCQKFDFRPIAISDIYKHIKYVCEQENTNIEDEAAIALAESAEGALRDALSFLDQAIALAEETITLEIVNDITGNLSYDKLLEIAQHVEDKEIEKALKAITELYNLGKETLKMVTSLISLYRDILVYKSFQHEKNEKYIFQKEQFKELAKILENNKIFYYVDILSDTQNKIKYSANPLIFLEVAIIKMINASSEDLDIVRRLNELETRIEEGGGGAGGSNASVQNLERNLIRITGELSKLELPILKNKVEALERKTANTLDVEDVRSVNTKLNNYEKEIKALRNDLATLNPSYLEGRLKIIESKIDGKKFESSGPAVINSEVDSKLLEKIDEIENQIKNLKSVSSSVDVEEISEKVNKLLKQNQSQEHEELDTLIARIEALEEAKPEEKISHYSETPKVELADIEKRVRLMEEQVYRLSAENYFESEEKRKPKRLSKKVADNQIMFFGDEVITVSEFENRDEQDFNFGAIIKESEEANKQEETLDEDLELEDSSEEYEEDLEQEEYELETEEQDEDESESMDDATIEAIEVEEAEDEDVYGDAEIDKASVSYRLKYQPDAKPGKISEGYIYKHEKAKEQYDITDAAYSVDKDKNKALDKEVYNLFNAKQEEKPKENKKETYATDDGIVVHSTHSTIVKKQSKDDYYEQKSMGLETPKVEVEEPKEKEPVQEAHIEVQSVDSLADLIDLVDSKSTSVEHKASESVVEPKVVKRDFSEEEAYENYSEDIILRIMIDALDKEARDDKRRITEIWPYLGESVLPQDVSVANLLKQGDVRAVGKKEIILVYESPMVCNQIMDKKTRRRALSIIEDKLGDFYNYMALPESDFSEKREEFAGYYLMGSIPKKLSPVRNPYLKNISNQKEKSITEELTDIFGPGIVKTEE